MKIKVSTENTTALMMFVLAFLLPLFVNAYKINIYAYFMTSILLSLSLSLIWGFTGIFSFGQAAFFGIGGYAYGILCKVADNPVFTPVAMVAAVVIAGLVAAILGYFMFYGGINDVFVGLITLCVTLALETFMGQTAGSQWQIAGIQLGGYNGLDAIPMLQFGSYKLGNTAFYLLILSVVLVVYLILRRLQVSKTGYSLLAIRENRSRGELFGYHVPRIQVIVFAAGGALAGLAGVLYASWGNYITPSNMSLTASTLPVVLVAAGGRKNATAAILFTAIYSVLSQVLSASGSPYALILLGAILLFVILFVPNGILASLFAWIDRLAGQVFRGRRNIQSNREVK